MKTPKNTNLKWMKKNAKNSKSYYEVKNKKR